MAIQDFRRRVLIAHRANRTTGIDLPSLLAIDPLTVLRCMRLLYSPVMAPDDEVITVPHLVKALGRTVVRRAFEVPITSSLGTGDVRRLWLHSVSTALAAEGLARSTGLLDPDVAYLLGLLIDLPDWVPYLNNRRRRQADDWADWGRDWNLPMSMLITVKSCWDNPPHEQQNMIQRIGTGEDLLRSACLLAQLADYWPPRHDAPENRAKLLALVSKEDFVAAQNLRQQVAHAVAQCGLVASRQVPDEAGEKPAPDSLRLFPHKNLGSLAEVVASLLKCSASTNYRGILTATTAAAIRYLDCERVFLVQWNKEAGRCWIRAKADLSLRALFPRRVDPTPAETEVLLHALANEQAVIATRPEEEADHGLLATLGVEEAMIVPVNVRFQTHSFLVLDRTLTGRGMELDSDAAHAEALCGTAAILNENLLLRNRGERSQLFALTDPLTRLFNRGVGIATLERELVRSRRQHSPMTLLMMDLDKFKQLNDSLGHLAGDQALRITADVLRKTLRRSDIACRYGGEEFLIVLPDTTIEQASISATRIYTAIEAAGLEHQLPLTASIGLTRVNPEEDSVASVLHRADRALYASKSRGRNRFSVDGE